MEYWKLAVNLPFFIFSLVISYTLIQLRILEYMERMSLVGLLISIDHNVQQQ
jgi:hypothetical protein